MHFVRLSSLPEYQVQKAEGIKCDILISDSQYLDSQLDLAWIVYQNCTQASTVPSQVLYVGTLFSRY